jgi:hypothetical protein
MAKNGEVALSFQPFAISSRSFFWRLIVYQTPRTCDMMTHVTGQKFSAVKKRFTLKWDGKMTRLVRKEQHRGEAI